MCPTPVFMGPEVPSRRLHSVGDTRAGKPMHTHIYLLVLARRILPKFFIFFPNFSIHMT